MSKKHHQQQQQQEAKPAEVIDELNEEPQQHTILQQVSLEEAQAEQQERIEADLDAVAGKVDKDSLRARMKVLRETQKAEMAKLKEEVKKEREKAKVEGKTGKIRNGMVGREVITARVILAIETPKSFDELATKCDEEYVKAAEGHKSNLKEARTVLRNHFSTVPIYFPKIFKIEGDVISRIASA